MALLNTQIKRPLLHHVIIIGYLLAPIFNVAIYVLVKKFPIWFVLSNFFKFFGVFGGIILISMPFVALGLYFVRKESFYLFVLHGILVLIDNLMKIFSHFSIYQLGLLMGSILLLTIIYYTLQKDFRAPYFQVLNRSFREKSRIPIIHFVKIQSATKKPLKVSINDLSSTGCYIVEKIPNIHIGQKFELEFNAQNLNFTCWAKIVRIDKNGYGVKFLNINRQTEQYIQIFIKSRFSLRYKVNISADLAFQKNSISGRIIDISKNGGFFQPDNDQTLTGITQIIDENKENIVFPTVVSISYHNNSITLLGNIVWYQATNSLNKPNGCALSFDKKTQKILRPIIKEISETAKLVR